MALKLRLIRRWRKEIRKLGKITRTEILNKDDDDTTILSDKREWGYVVDCTINGYTISSYGQNWYEAWRGAVYSARWAVKQAPFEQKDDFNLVRETDSHSAIVGLHQHKENGDHDYDRNDFIQSCE